MDADSLFRAEVLSDVFAQLVRVSLSEQVVETVTSADVTYAQFETLRYIQRHPHATVGDLSEGLHISYPSATNIVARLQRKQLVLKRGTRADRRLVKLSLSPAGDKLVDEVCRAREARIAQTLAAMSPFVRNQFTSGLDGFIQAACRCGAANLDDLCLACGPQSMPDCPLVQAGTGHQCR